LGNIRFVLYVIRRQIGGVLQSKKGSLRENSLEEKRRRIQVESKRREVEITEDEPFLGPTSPQRGGDAGGFSDSFWE